MPSNSYKFAILVPIRSVALRGKTGDYYYAESLAQAFCDKGCAARVVTQEERKSISSDEIAVLIRGRAPFLEKLGRLTITWCISKPPRPNKEDVSISDQYFAASQVLTKRIRRTPGTAPAELMYQAFDQEVMYPGADNGSGHLVFVGTPREERLRPVVGFAAQSGLPFRLWGNGWEKTPYAQFQVGGNVSNEKLGDIYRSGSVVINDHMPDMKKFLVTSNRVFDAIACARPVLSDLARGFPPEFEPMVYHYSDAKSFKEAAKQALMAASKNFEQHCQIAKCARDQHSFHARADQLIAKVTQLIGTNGTLDAKTNNKSEVQ